MNNYYDENAKSFFENTIDIDMSEFYEKFIKYLKPNSYVLDLGCGSGRDMLYFKSMGYKVLGIDASEELVKLAQKHTNEKVLQMDFRDLNFEKEFDGIWACASLLHLRRSEVTEVIKKSIFSLKKNGIFYMSFKYGEFDGIRNGRQFTDFNENLMQNLLNKFTEIEVLEQWISNDRRKGRENERWINVVVKKA